MSHHGRNVVKPADVIESPSKATHPAEGSPTRAVNENVNMTEVNRAVLAGAGKHRGDQRDRSQTYTGNERHSTRGNTPRKDVSTRVR